MKKELLNFEEISYYKRKYQESRQRGLLLSIDECDQIYLMYPFNSNVMVAFQDRTFREFRSYDIFQLSKYLTNWVYFIVIIDVVPYGLKDTYLYYKNNKKGILNFIPKKPILETLK